MSNVIARIVDTQPIVSFDVPLSVCSVDIADDLEHWAKDFAEQAGLLHKIPEKVRPYFNYAAWAHDARQSGKILVLELFKDTIAVFYKKAGVQ